MKSKIIFATVFAAALCLLTHAHAAPATAAASSNPVIAKGNGFEIKRGELDDAMAGIRNTAAAHNQAISPDQAVRIEKQILNQLIEIKLLLAKATDADKVTAKKGADLRMTALLENLGSQEKLDQQLKAAGETADEERSKVADQLSVQAVLQREVKVDVTDEEVKKYYDTHAPDFEQPEMVRISHILIYTVDPVTRATLPADQQQAKRRLADDLLKNIRAGADFTALAKQVSEDPGSKDNGGVLLPFPRGQMLREIEDAAFSLTNSQVSDVVTTASGYQIVKLLEKIPSKKMGYLAAIADIKQGLTRQKFAQLAPAYLEKLKKDARVEILDPALKLESAATAAPSGK